MPGTSREERYSFGQFIVSLYPDITPLYPDITPLYPDITPLYPDITPLYLDINPIFIPCSVLLQAGAGVATVAGGDALVVVSQLQLQEILQLGRFLHPSSGSGGLC